MMMTMIIIHINNDDHNNDDDGNNHNPTNNTLLSGVRTPPAQPKILLKTRGGGSYPDLGKSAGALKIRGGVLPRFGLTM